MDEVTVLWWRYRDNSAAGVVRVYESDDEAVADQELLAQGGERLYFVERLPVLAKRKEPK